MTKDELEKVFHRADGWEIGEDSLPIRAASPEEQFQFESYVGPAYDAAVEFRDCLLAFGKRTSDTNCHAAKEAFDFLLENAEPPEDYDSPVSQCIALYLEHEYREIIEQWSPLFERIYNGETVLIDCPSLWPWKPPETAKVPYRYRN